MFYFWCTHVYTWSVRWALCAQVREPPGMTEQGAGQPGAGQPGAGQPGVGTAALEDWMRVQQTSPCCSHNLPTDLDSVRSRLTKAQLKARFTAAHLCPSPTPSKTPVTIVLRCQK